MSHAEKEIVMEVIETMKGCFGEGATTEGNKHSFLGMNITITKYKSIQIKVVVFWCATYFVRMAHMYSHYSSKSNNSMFVLIIIYLYYVIQPAV